MVNKFLTRLEFGLLPGRCLLCGLASHQPLDLCRPCIHRLPWLLNACPSCALPLSSKQAGQACARCLQNSPPFRQIISPWRYENPIDDLISGFKYHRHFAAGRVLAELCGDHILHSYSSQHLPDLMIPTPLHYWRQWHRGFNQSQQLADSFSKTTGIPIKRCLKRRRATPHQQGLNAKERRCNLKNAFVATEDLMGKLVGYCWNQVPQPLISGVWPEHPCLIVKAVDHCYDGADLNRRPQ
jgi:ComF family protein